MPHVFLFSRANSLSSLNAKHFKNMRGTLQVKERYSKMLQIESVLASKNQKRKCTISTNEVKNKKNDNPCDSFKIIVSAYNEISPNDDQELNKDSWESNNLNQSHFKSHIRCDSKVIDFEDDKSSSSLDQISNYTWSSTSSKVSVNKDFVKSARPSHKSSSIHVVSLGIQNNDLKNVWI